MTATTFTVIGSKLVSRVLDEDDLVVESESWEPFKVEVKADDKAAARWQARRQVALGESAAKLEDQPPNSEREAVEVQDPRYPRSAPRSAAESFEYDRLVQTVQITAVLAPDEKYESEVAR